MKVDFHGQSDVGRVRSRNEDAWRVVPELRLFVVADGMGGHPAGDVAASIAVEALCSYAEEHFTQEGDPVVELREAILWANEAVYHHACQDRSLHGMGTTLCALRLTGRDAVLGHVGDSRIYRLEEGVLTQMTHDHSLVAEMVDQGRMTQEEAAHSAKRSVITRAIGTSEQVQPTILRLPLSTEQQFLLCTDGLSDYVSSEEMGEAMMGSLREQGERLGQLALSKGGADNITFVLVGVGL